MRWISPAATGGRRYLIGVLADWILICALLAFLSADAGAQTPAGTRIVTHTTVTYQYENATFAVVASVAMVVGQVAGVDVDPPREATVAAGATAVFSHLLVNAGNGSDAISISASSAAGWVSRVYLDVDADGALGAADKLATGPILLAMGQLARFLVVVDVPDTRGIRGAVDSVSVTAVSGFDAAVSDALVDRLTIRDAGVVVTLGKSVDRPTATVGDVVTYTIAYAATGTGAATDLEITDAIPTGASYLPGTMRWNLKSLTDADDDDAGFLDSGKNLILFRIGRIAGGESGVVTFQVRVDR